MRRQLSMRILFGDCGQVGERGAVSFNDNPSPSARRSERRASLGTILKLKHAEQYSALRYSRKKVMPLCAVVTARTEAAVLKSCVLNRTDRGHCGRAFRKALYSRERFVHRASLASRKGTLCD